MTSALPGCVVRKRSQPVRATRSRVIGGRYGLSSKDTTGGTQMLAVFENLKMNERKASSR